MADSEEEGEVGEARESRGRVRVPAKWALLEKWRPGEDLHSWVQSVVLCLLLGRE